MSTRLRVGRAGEDPGPPLRRTYAARTYLGAGAPDPGPNTALGAQAAALIQSHPARSGGAAPGRRVRVPSSEERNVRCGAGATSPSLTRPRSRSLSSGPRLGQMDRTADRRTALSSRDALYGNPAYDAEAGRAAMGLECSCQRPDPTGLSLCHRPGLPACGHGSVVPGGPLGLLRGPSRPLGLPFSGMCRIVRDTAPTRRGEGGGWDGSQPPFT
jgi:hypothetical protein